MKIKLLAGVLAGALTISMALLSVSAAEIHEDSDPKTVEAVITTSISPTYTVTIPADTSVTFNTLETSFGSIEVIAAQIDPDKCIRVTLTTDGELNNQADEAKVIPYAINDANGDVFTSADYLAVGDKTDLTINITQDDWNKAAAGAYTDTVTFTVSYENRTTN